MHVASLAPEMAYMMHEIDMHLCNEEPIEQGSELHTIVRELLEKVVGD